MADIEQVTFEAAMARLSEIVTRMEEANLPLHEALDLFEEGNRLGKHCTALLDTAELRVQQMTVDGDGRAEIIPLRFEEPAF